MYIRFVEKLLSSLFFFITVCCVPLNAVIVFCVLYAVIAPHVTKRLRSVEPKIGYVRSRPVLNRLVYICLK